MRVHSKLSVAHRLFAQRYVDLVLASLHVAESVPNAPRAGARASTQSGARVLGVDTR